MPTEQLTVHRPVDRVAGTIRVASVPAGHVYIEHLADVAVPDVVRLLDPPPGGEDMTPGRWWPPAMLDPVWIRAHAREFDVFHVHFGFDALSPAELVATVNELDAVGVPLVYTVHDLRNPHHASPGAHNEHLEVLISRAAQLITLTPGAAAEIRRRWSRDVTVLPHPHVVGFDRMRTLDAPRGREFVVGVHAKSLRPSMDPLPVIEGLLPLSRELPDLRIRVDVHRDVADVDGARHDPFMMSSLRRYEDEGRVELRVHDCFSDADLWDYLQGLGLSVLPYRFGTHSGWLEACRDLGTPVAAPSCGFYAQQGPCLTFCCDESGLDVSSLQDAVRYAYFDRRRSSASVPFRQAQRRALAEAHRTVYRSALR